MGGTLVQSAFFELHFNFTVTLSSKVNLLPKLPHTKKLSMLYGWFLLCVGVG